jgi:hypothetical protein
MNATRARTGDRFQDSVVSIERVNLLGVQVTAPALLNCAEHERRGVLGLGTGRRGVLGLGAVTDPALLDRLLGLPSGYPRHNPACGRRHQRSYRHRGPQRRRVHGYPAAGNRRSSWPT